MLSVPGGVAHVCVRLQDEEAVHELNGEERFLQEATAYIKRLDGVLQPEGT
jgi:hypothetical protein